MVLLFWLPDSLAQETPDDIGEGDVLAASARINSSCAPGRRRGPGWRDAHDDHAVQVMFPLISTWIMTTSWVPSERKTSSLALVETPGFCHCEIGAITMPSAYSKRPPVDAHW